MNTKNDSNLSKMAFDTTRKGRKIDRVENKKCFGELADSQMS